MAPHLQDGDRFIGWLITVRTTPRRGCVVAFPHPRRSGFWLVKRVVGLPGEMVTIDTGEVLIDRRSGDDRWGQGFSAPDGEWIVPAGKLFVLSDRRSRTRDDSRSFGPVPAANLYRMVYLANRHRTWRLSFRTPRGRRPA